MAHLPKIGSASSLALASRRCYRLVDQEGVPHPVLDDLYDSLEAAWSEALTWWDENGQGQAQPAIGIEVSTSSGAWRSVRAPGG
ncbi:MAG: hypothetical protein ACKN89_10835 [Cyanobium sp.]